MGPTGPPVELADAEALTTLADWRALPAFAPGSYHQASSRDRLTGAPEPAAILEHGNHDMNNFVCRSADAAIAPLQIVPFAYDEPTCPEPWVRGAVLARFAGSGRLARLWLTQNSIRGGTAPDDERLRVWVDDEATPVVDVPLATAIDGSAGEMLAPPFGAGASDFLAWRYPVVFAEKLVVALDGIGPADLVYHQTAVVLDPSPRGRVRGAERLPERDAARATLEATTDGAVEGAVLLGPEALSLPPDTDVVVADLPGPATIHDLRVELASSDLSALASVDWFVEWDDAATSAIALPLSELFAAALAPPEGASLALAGASAGGNTSLDLRLPMPFSTRARLRAHSHLAAPLSLAISVRGEPSLPPAPWGHLHVERRETLAPASSVWHGLGSATGRGRWLGSCAALEGHGLGDGSIVDAPLNFLEGDERATVDGGVTIEGTGTEDFFDGAFYFEAGPSATAFAQWWDVATVGTSGRASACRFHVLGDEVDFASSLDLSLEIGPGVPEMLERYRTVTFFYLDD